MSDIVFSKYHDTEIAKADDFRFTASSPVDIIAALFDGAFDDVLNSFVFSGMEVSQLASPTMNVQLAPGLAFNRSENKLLHLYSAASALVNPSHPSLDRLDTLEARYFSTDFNPETRAFKSPETGAISYNLVNTKTKVFLELRCVEGIAGSGVAPNVETGWMKLAEVQVMAGSTQIINANIRNITAEEDGEENTAWTAEKSNSFHLGSIESIKNTLYSHIRNNITSLSTVHGIRQGHGNGFDGDTLDGEHGSFYRNINNINTGDYIFIVDFIHGTPVKELRIRTPGSYQSILTIGSTNENVEGSSSNYAKEATVTLYLSRKYWFDLYADISLHRLAGDPKFVTFLRATDGMKIPSWQLQIRKAYSGVGRVSDDNYVTLLSCDWEATGGILEVRQGSVICKLSESGSIDSISAITSSGPYYVDASRSGLPVAENGVLYHAQSPYSTSNATQEYQSFADPTNHFRRSRVSGTWSAWRKIVTNQNVKGTFSISNLGSENTGLTKPLTLSADGEGKGFIGVDGDADILELTSGNLKVNGALEATTLKSSVATGTAPLIVASTTMVENLNADLVDGKQAADFVWKADFYGSGVGNIIIPGLEIVGEFGSNLSTYEESVAKMASPITGNVRVYYKARKQSGGTSGYSRPYINGEPAGVERTLDTSVNTYYDDLSLQLGDVVEIRVKSNSTSYSSYVKHIALCRNGSGKYYTALI